MSFRGAGRKILWPPNWAISVPSLYAKLSLPSASCSLYLTDKYESSILSARMPISISQNVEPFIGSVYCWMDLTLDFLNNKKITVAYMASLVLKELLLTASSSLNFNQTEQQQITHRAYSWLKIALECLKKQYLKATAHNKQRQIHSESLYSWMRWVCFC